MTKDKTYLELSNNAKKRFVDYIKDNNLALVAVLYAGEKVMELNKFKKNDNFKPVYNASELVVGELVSVFINGIQQYAIVKKVSDVEIIVSTVFNDNIIINLNRNVVFKEIS